MKQITATTAALLVVLSSTIASATIWDVQMTDLLTFEPAVVSVAAGDTVRWTNVATSVSHTATANSALARRAGFNSGTFPTQWLAPGESFEFTFTRAGEFPYHCIPHGELGMVGTVVVNPPAAPRPEFVSATAERGAVVVAWRVGSRSGRAGFHVLRSTAWGEDFVQVNPGLIPGDSSGTSVYTFVDTTVARGTEYHYVLEDVDAAGKSAFWGPAVVVTGR